MISDECGWAIMAVNNCGVQQLAFPDAKPFCDVGIVQPTGGCKCRAALTAVAPMILEESAKVASHYQSEETSNCEYRGIQDWETGEVPCEMEQRGGDCRCATALETAMAVAAAIRAMGDGKPSPRA